MTCLFSNLALSVFQASLNIFFIRERNCVLSHPLCPVLQRDFLLAFDTVLFLSIRIILKCIFFNSLVTDKSILFFLNYYILYYCSTGFSTKLQYPHVLHAPSPSIPVPSLSLQRPSFCPQSTCTPCSCPQSIKVHPRQPLHLLPFTSTQSTQPKNPQPLQLPHPRILSGHHEPLSHIHLHFQ